MNITNLRGNRTWKVAGLLYLATRLGTTDSDHRGASVKRNANQTVAVPHDDLKWQANFRELVNECPEISVLHVDPTSRAAQLMTRTPKAMHVPMYWRSAEAL